MTTEEKREGEGGNDNLCRDRTTVVVWGSAHI